jgi:hypothetical protein
MDGHAAVGAANVLFAIDGHVEATGRVFDLAKPVPPIEINQLFVFSEAVGRRGNLH